MHTLIRVGLSWVLQNNFSRYRRSLISTNKFCWRSFFLFSFHFIHYDLAFLSTEQYRLKSIVFVLFLKKKSITSRLLPALRTCFADTASVWAVVTLAIWFGSLSCWKTYPWPIFSVLAEESRFSSEFFYMAAFIGPFKRAMSRDRSFRGKVNTHVAKRIQSVISPTVRQNDMSLHFDVLSEHSALLWVSDTTICHQAFEYNAVLVMPQHFFPFKDIIIAFQRYEIFSEQEYISNAIWPQEAAVSYYNNCCFVKDKSETLAELLGNDKHWLEWNVISLRTAR